ncbi:putative RNA methylase family UPF0020-domain-containing protein [Circinella umbellata]|nr:putative RNA methylase family UPF0020-domain-containing protein [Circinella umbellata]
MVSNSKHVHILFHVPEGLEFIAKNEVNAKITSQLKQQSTAIVADSNTGRVHLICHQTKLPTLITLLNSIHLLSVRETIVVASMVEFPAQEFDNNDKTCEFITETTTNTKFDPILASLKYHHHSKKEEEKDKTVAGLFRGTFYKEDLKHKVKSPELASWVGFGFGKKYPDYKVKLEGYDYEIVGLWTQKTMNPILWNHKDGGIKNSNDNNNEDEQQQQDRKVLLMIGVTIRTQDTKFRNRQFFGKTSMNPCIAYCLAQVANPSAGQVVLDMCCGTGTIPIEGASCFPNVLWIGSEVQEITLCEKAKGNVEHTCVNNVELMLGDGRNLCFRDQSVDIILTDWPWGLREGSYLTIQRLYPKFMKQIGRVLKSKGKAYIVTQGHKLFNQVLNYPWCKAMWDVDEVKSIGIGGYNVSLYILSKKL